MERARAQAITGLVPPSVGEALIREVWPSLAAHSRAAGLARTLIRSKIGAPLGWLVLFPFFVLRILPFRATRYSLTNRRVMIRRGLKPAAVQEIPLAAIDDVRIVRDANSEFFRAGTLEVLCDGKVLMTLRGVPEPDSFRNSVLDASRAWAPGKIAGAFVPAKAAAAN